MRFLRIIHSRIYPGSPSVNFPYHLLEEEQMFVPKSSSLSSVIMADCPLSFFLVPCSKNLSTHFLEHLKHPRIHWPASQDEWVLFQTTHPQMTFILGLPLGNFISPITCGYVYVCVTACVYAHVCTCFWRLVVNIGCLSQSLFGFNFSFKL